MLARRKEDRQTESQIISKQRIVNHGEVLTGEREVNAMLDLVKHETERIDSRFLEPACGNGNFLAAILERKLEVVGSRYSKSQTDYERNAVLSVSSLYGIDILPDNVCDCRERLFELFDARYTEFFKKKVKDGCRAAVRFILKKNIVCGDALTLQIEGDTHRPIVFAQWSLIGGKFKRMDYAFRDLSQPEPKGQGNLFSQQQGLVKRDTGEKGFIPEPIRSDYPPVPYWELPNAN